MSDADRVRAKRKIADMADVSHALVTVLLAGDRDGAAAVMMAMFPSEDENDPLLVTLALVLADLVVFVHRGWSGQVGVDPQDAWRVLMEQMAGLRIERETP